MSSKSIQRLALLSLFSVIYGIVMNYLAIALPINDNSTGELADKYENYFVPAGFTFSIWGIIYLSLLLYCGFLLVKAYRKDVFYFPYIEKLSVWFIIANVACGSWLVFWHYEWVVISLIVMLVILFMLLDMYYTLSDMRPHPLAVNIFIFTPVSIFLGWISVATIANVTAALVSVQWEGLFSHPSLSASVMVVVAAVLGVILIYKRKDVVFGWVIAWALYGIYAKRTSAGDAYSLKVADVAQYGFTLLLIYSLLALIGKKSYYFEVPSPEQSRNENI